MLKKGDGQDYGVFEAPGKGQGSLSYWENWVVAFGTCDGLGGGGRQVADVIQGAPRPQSSACTLASVVCTVPDWQSRAWPCAWHMGRPLRTSDRPH